MCLVSQEVNLSWVRTGEAARVGVRLFIILSMIWGVNSMVTVRGDVVGMNADFGQEGSCDRCL